MKPCVRTDIDFIMTGRNEWIKVYFSKFILRYLLILEADRIIFITSIVLYKLYEIVRSPNQGRVHTD